VTNFTIDQAKEMKSSLEALIQVHLIEFMTTYGVVVDGIDVDLIDVTSMDSPKPQWIPTVHIRASLR